MLQGGLLGLPYVWSGGGDPVIVTLAGCSAEYALNREFRSWQVIVSFR